MIKKLTFILLLLVSCDKKTPKEAKKENANISSYKKDIDSLNPDQALVSNNTKTANKTTTKNIELNGFIFISIKDIYYGEKNLLIKNKTDTLAYFNRTKVYFEDKSFDIIEEDYKYDELIKCKSYDPEYGLFIVKCKGIQGDDYVVDINNEEAFINKSKHHDVLKFKTLSKYVLDGYPHLVSDKTPLRKEPNELSEIVENYTSYSYVSVEIKGDWLRVKDDKECFLGEAPPKEMITGWVRWKKNGKIIIDIRHLC